VCVRLRKRLVTSESNILLFISRVSLPKYGFCLDNIVMFLSLFNIQILSVNFLEQVITKKYGPNDGKYDSSRVVL
jgi:hypothetical protein